MLTKFSMFLCYYVLTKLWQMHLAILAFFTFEVVHWQNIGMCGVMCEFYVKVCVYLMMLMIFMVVEMQIHREMEHNVLLVIG